MPILPDKYIAGFMDADGCIAVLWSPDCCRPQMTLTASQREDHDSVLDHLQRTVGGSIRTVQVMGGRYTAWTLCGSKARMLLDRIRKHLVIKRHYAEVVLGMVNRPVQDRMAAKLMLKAERRVRSEPLPNFPSRKWMAGYIDGDGCFSVGSVQYGNAYPLLHIAASSWDTEGIEIIQKQFGGRIHPMKTKNGSENVKQYVLYLNPSKAIQVLEYCGKHLIVKREQADFLLSCARMGHYHDGKRIQETLKQLKTHPQRLNESAAMQMTEATV